MKSYSPDKHRKKYPLEEERFGTGFGMVDDATPYSTASVNPVKALLSSASLPKSSSKAKDQTAPEA